MQARKDASKVPTKPNQKEVFDGVWLSQHKLRGPNKAPEPIAEQRDHQNISPVRPTVPISSIPTTLEPTPVDVRKPRYNENEDIQMKDPSQPNSIPIKAQTKPFNTKQPYKNLVNLTPATNIPSRENKENIDKSNRIPKV
jgi:hypothetical protein